LLWLIEYAPYPDLRRLLPRDRFLKEWPELALRFRSNRSSSMMFCSVLDNASAKAAGIFPPLEARSLAEGLRLGLPNVAWQNHPRNPNFKPELRR
jgi:hypothetical protein